MPRRWGPARHRLPWMAPSLHHSLPVHLVCGAPAPASKRRGRQRPQPPRWMQRMGPHQGTRRAAGRKRRPGCRHRRTVTTGCGCRRRRMAGLRLNLADRLEGVGPSRPAGWGRGRQAVKAVSGRAAGRRAGAGGRSAVHSRPQHTWTHPRLLHLRDRGRGLRGRPSVHAGLRHGALRLSRGFGVGALRFHPAIVRLVRYLPCLHRPRPPARGPGAARRDLHRRTEGQQQAAPR